MARPKTFEDAEVLDRAVQVFWTHGYEGSSIADLEEATGLGRQSLYNTFGDKRRLFLAALKHYMEQAEGQRRRLQGRGLDGVQAFFAGSIEFLMGHRRGCLLTRARLEEAGTRGVPELCDSNERSIRTLLTQRLEEAAADGTLRADVSPQVAGRMLATWVQGLSAASAAGAEPHQLLEEVTLLVSGLRSPESAGG